MNETWPRCKKNGKFKCCQKIFIENQKYLKHDFFLTKLIQFKTNLILPRLVICTKCDL